MQAKQGQDTDVCDSAEALRARCNVGWRHVMDRSVVGEEAVSGEDVVTGYAHGAKGLPHAAL